MDFWAKTNTSNEPGISVRDHCLNVGCVAEVIIQLLPPNLRSLLPVGAATLAALHDIGKISPGFQAKCLKWLALQDLTIQEQISWRGSQSNHALVSQFYLQDKVDRRWAAAVGAHHGKILGRGSDPVRIREVQGQQFSKFREEVSSKIEKLLGSLPKLDKPKESIRWFLAGLITVADWLGSNEEFFPLSWPEQDDAEMQKRRECAEHCLSILKWSAEQPINHLGFESIFSLGSASQKPFIANPLQQAVASHITTPGLYLIEGPMGCGKTEAALFAAYQLIEKGHHHGFFFGLPTQVTSNRIHQRVEKFLSNCYSHSSQIYPQLTHSNSWLKQNVTLNPSYRSRDSSEQVDDHSFSGHAWFNPTKRALLAQFGVGTVDQALLGIVRAKHFFVRQFALAGKVVILDEVHSYDLYTGTLIDKLIERLLELKCTVLVLSATLTNQRRKELLALASPQTTPISSSYPLLSGVSNGTLPFEAEIEDSQQRSVFITCTSKSTVELAEECLNRAKDGACVLWIRNTVNEAQETWKLLKSTNMQDGPEIGLLHSRFPFWRREDLEEKWIQALGKDASNRPKGCVLVSTQVVEQSVDIDADFLVTDLAPTDMLFQRMGRLWRHQRQRRPQAKAEAWIVTPDLSMLTTKRDIRSALGKGGKVYAPYVLLRSWQSWASCTEVQLPRDIRLFLEKTYSPPSTDELEAWHEFAQEVEEHRKKQRQRAESLSRVESDIAVDDDESVTTRWGSQQTAQVLLLRSADNIDDALTRITPLQGDAMDVNDRARCFSTIRSIHENLVRVPYWCVKSACAQAPLWLKNYVYGSCAVAVISDSEQLKFLGEDNSHELSWNEDEGIRMQSSERHLKKVYDEDESCD